jgi:hypothetical protein
MKAAIATTFKDAGSCLDTFVEYHLSIGFDYILLFFDDPEESCSPALEARSNVIVIKHDDSLRQRWRRTRIYRGLEKFIHTEYQARQMLNICVAMDMLIALKVDWLLNIDVDELFYSQLPDVREHFEEMTAQGISAVSYRNHEAIPEKMIIDNFFKEVTLFKKNKMGLHEEQKRMIDDYNSRGHGYFRYYTNGKSAVRVGRNVLPGGSHSFVFTKSIFQPFKFFSREKSVATSDPCILHYSCCGFNFFWRKYQVLGNFDDKWFGVSEIKKWVPFHVDARDICNQNDKQLAEEFYKEKFLETPFADRDIFVHAGVCFDVDIPSKLKQLGLK